MARSLIVAAAIVGLARAKKYTAFALPNGDWAGIDGNWSTVEFSLGSDSQPVNVLVGTALSEFWAVGTGGCYPNEPHCSDARGGLYTPEDSSDWDDLGTWHLGLDYLGYSGNGHYGFDKVTTTSDIQGGKGFSMHQTLMASVNTTDHFLGIFGLGITQGNFESTVARSPVTVAVQEYGLIPSYSYGYTAGAHYRNTPASVTLGGYDAARFVDHNNEFVVTKSDSLLRTLVRGIEVSTSDNQSAPDEWDADTQLLSQMNSSFTALIDTSTPFLYLPDNVCDAFVEALNMTYHDSIELYGLSNDQYRDFRSEDSFNFVFSLSSTDNNDNFGEPLNVPGVVNITIPMRAFVSTVEYPFHDQAIEYGEPAQPYFSLRKSGDNETFIIGRSFFQEAYLLTQYDEQVFTIHEALFPENPNGEADIQSLMQPDDSPYPPPAAIDRDGLSKGEIAGIVVGGSAGVVLALVALWYCRRRRKNTHAHTAVADSEEEKTSTNSLKPDAAHSNSPLSRIWAKVARRNRSNSRVRSRGESQPMEAPNTQIYEMPAPAAPVELHANDDNDIVDEGDLDLQGQGVSAYEQQRLKLDRQLAGPVPEYTPPATGMMPPPEKAAYHYEARVVPERRAVPDRRPVASHGSISPQAPTSNNSNSMPSNGSLVSPISPGAGWANNPDNRNYQSPSASPLATDAPQLPLARNQPRSDPNLNNSAKSTSDRSVSPSSINLHPINIQRTPIDPSKVVCLGPLPENIQLRGQPSLPHIVGSDGTRLNPPNFTAEAHNEYESTLGSNYTEEEERMREYQSQLQASQRASEQGSHGSHPLSQSYGSEGQHQTEEIPPWQQEYYGPTTQPQRMNTHPPQSCTQQHYAEGNAPWLQEQHNIGPSQPQRTLTHPQPAYPEQQQAYSHTQYYPQPQPQQQYQLQEQHQLSQWEFAAQAGKRRLQQQWAHEEEVRRLTRLRSSQQQNTYNAPAHDERPPQPTHFAQTSSATYIPGRDQGMGEMEFIHVPQPAEKRFSWEDDRSMY